MKAKCVLTRGPLTHTYRGRVFKRGQPQTLTKDHEINYYKTVYGFTVTMLAGEKKKIKKKIKKKVYTFEELDAKKKTKLISLAEKHQAPLTGKEKKPELIEAILAAQDFED